ncbi:MAG: glycoside hydrolase family 16 protein [Myxococcota bacterium]|nr:glycoside hydrolase family 16 protein [Myxococcota bacterium]
MTQACGAGSTVDGTAPSERSDATAPTPSGASDATAVSPSLDVVLDAGAGSARLEASAPGDAGIRPGWTLLWADEFEGRDGSAADPSKWVHDVGGSGGGNREREYYTDGTANAVVQGGQLVITADMAGAAPPACWYGPCQYTSARLKTQGKFAQAYGRFEARIQIPYGQGMWPAFWMLGDDITQVQWPACGEIDIMENIGREPALVHGSLHGPGYPGAGLTGVYSLAAGKLADSFHTFAAEWEPTAVRFYVDDRLYETQTPANVPAGSPWPFEHAFFLVLDLAVGGTWPGDPDPSTTFPQTMKIDWVRVFQKTNGEGP